MFALGGHCREGDAVCYCQLVTLHPKSAEKVDFEKALTKPKKNLPKPKYPQNQSPFALVGEDERRTERGVFQVGHCSSKPLEEEP